METKELQKQIKKLENEKKTTEQKINSLKTQLENESDKSEWIKIPKTNYEITKDVIYKGKSYNEIIKLKKPEEELLDLEIIGKICKLPELLKQLKMDSSSSKDDFFFKQPFPQNEERDRVARFGAGSYYAGLGCYENSSNSGSYLGVRFVRRTKVKK